jgi:AcrR family transcriptional regulator
MEKELLDILKKVNTLYQKYGIKSITMDDVAKKLGISKKTLYQYVKDKADLVEKVIMLEIKDKQKISKEFINNKKINVIEKAIQVHKFIDEYLKNVNFSIEYDLRKYYPDLYKKIQEMRRKNMYESMLRNMKKGKKEGLYRKDLNVELIAKLQIFRAENLLDNGMFSKKDFTIETFNELLTYHIRGIASNKGIKYFEKFFNKNMSK